MYLKDCESSFGYRTGIAIANRYGFTTQISACHEICSNIVLKDRDEITVEKHRVILYRPKTKINSENVKLLQFLDLVEKLDVFSEVTGDEYKRRLNGYIKHNSVDLSKVKEYVHLYTSKVYVNLRKGGIRI